MVDIPPGPRSDIGRAREKEGAADLAIDAYQSVVEKFPNDPLAVDAQYQIGYIWLAATRAGTYDPDAADRARTAFQDFLFRYPKSEKAAQARENLALLDHRLDQGLARDRKILRKAKNYRAAVLYYNEVIRQQPGSPESDIARKRESSNCVPRSATQPCNRPPRSPSAGRKIINRKPSQSRRAKGPPTPSAARPRRRCAGIPATSRRSRHRQILTRSRRRPLPAARPIPTLRSARLLPRRLKLRPRHSGENACRGRLFPLVVRRMRRLSSRADPAILPPQRAQHRGSNV